MKNIDTFDFTNKTVIIRVDFNVPLNDKFEITDDTNQSRNSYNKKSPVNPIRNTGLNMFMCFRNNS